jgi:CheY-like chemotaxis protein
MTLPVFSDAESARYLRHAAVQKLADGSLVSLNLTDGMMPSIMRDGYRWVITVRKQEVEPDKTVEVVLASADRGEAKASLSLEGASVADFSGQYRHQASAALSRIQSVAQPTGGGDPAAC